MQNRFRFRVWKANEKRMVEGVTYLNSLILDEDIAAEEAKNNVLMQCTGLKDKNGKLIYEGDIVEFYSQSFLDALSRKGLERRIGKVVWNDEYLKFDVVVKNNAIPDLCKATDDNNFIVIGNIYENKSLLESEEK